jgi:hypothetical protein
VRLAWGWSTTGQAGKSGFHVIEVRRNIRVSSQSKSHPGRVLAMLTAMIAVLSTLATLAAPQDQPAPKGGEKKPPVKKKPRR